MVGSGCARFPPFDWTPGSWGLTADTCCERTSVPGQWADPPKAAKKTFLHGSLGMMTPVEFEQAHFGVLNREPQPVGERQSNWGPLSGEQFRPRRLSHCGGGRPTPIGVDRLGVRATAVVCFVLLPVAALAGTLAHGHSLSWRPPTWGREG